MALDDLSDVIITTPATAQVLRYNGTNWVNAALVWTDVSKTGSSLADLATRSAADLSSGNLAYGRLPTGSGTWDVGANTLTLRSALLRNYNPDANAATETIGLEFQGQDAGAADQVYGILRVVIDDATGASEDAHWEFVTLVGGSQIIGAKVTGSTISAGSAVMGTDPGGAALFRDGITADGEALRVRRMGATNNPVVIIGFVEASAKSYLDYSGSTGTFNLEFRQGGTPTVVFAAGITVGSPTGGDKGAGTINAQAVYDDNVLLTDYVFEIAHRGLALGQPAPLGYRQRGLLELEDYTRQWGHLPGSAHPGEAKRSLGQNTNFLIEKLEEGYLHLFSHERRIAELERRMAA
jgi:hypothetical protein